MFICKPFNLSRKMLRETANSDRPEVSCDVGQREEAPDTTEEKAFAGSTRTDLRLGPL